MKEHVLNKNYIESGMILKFNYTKVSGEKKEYTVIVVDKNHQGKMHAINAEQVSPSSLAGMGIVTSQRLQRARGINIPIIQNMESAGFNGYRTFIVGNIGKCVVLEWPFPAQQIQAAEELDIPKSSIEAMETFEVIKNVTDVEDESQEQEIRQQNDDVIVRQLKQKLQDKFIEGKQDEN